MAKADSTPSSASPLSAGRLLQLVLLGGAVAAATLLVVYFVPTGEQEPDPAQDSVSAEELLEQANAALRSGQLDRASTLVAGLLDHEALADPALMIAGEAKQRGGEFEKAAEYYLRAAGIGGPQAATAYFFSGEILRTLGRLEESIRAFEESLQIDSDNVDAHARLAFLYAVTGQRWEAEPHYMAMVRAQAWTLDSLAMVADVERPVEQPEFVRQSAAANPSGPLTRLALAHVAVQAGDEDRAREILEPLLKERPDLVAAQAIFGELLLSLSEAEQAQWERQLPASASDHPDIWFARGMIARSQNDIDLAIACFSRAVELKPEFRRAIYQLGQLFSQKQASGAEAFVQRAETLMQMTGQLDEVLRSRGQSQDALRKVAEASEQVGRWLEAWAWCVTAVRLHGELPWARELVARVQPQLNANMPRTIPAADLAQANGLEQFSNVAVKAFADRPKDGSVADSSTPRDSVPGGLASEIRFASADVGMDFRYENGSSSAVKGARMFEQTGGGVGVIDYDLDGRPDLYFPQGSPWEVGSQIPTPQAGMRDALYRNLDDEHFQEIALSAGIENLRFGQGVSIGDFNADGFADVRVADVGSNRLYVNNGDGTFAEVSDAVSGAVAAWTTSCALVDLNGDSLPDIFDVNYLQGDEVFTLTCEDRACSPSVFAGAPDHVFLNLGNGQFKRIENATPTQESKGLGVLVARFGDDPLLGMFIANDQVPNYFLQATVPEDGVAESMRLVDRALLKGLAYNADGLAMACMGVAADDLDGNGLVDMLVTNFRDESNSLYVQDAPGLFVDATRQAGLRAPSYPFVGWGTQFLDADLDGNADLVVTNGHVDDYRPDDPLYEMPTQFFRNVGNARFEELEPTQLGPYFEGLYLGRGLARLDWNGDGLMEFAVSNIGAKAGLLKNVSRGVGRHVTIELVGTASAREPVGAVVEAVAGDRRWSHQWTAGDGYLASNQRLIQFGVGNIERLDRLVVRWPSGVSSVLNAVPTNRRITIIEGRSEVFDALGAELTAETQSEPSESGNL